MIDEFIENRIGRLHKDFQYGYAKKFFDKLRQFEYVCVWGTGEQSRKFIEYANKEVRINFCSDNNPLRWNVKIKDIPCISPEALLEYREKVVVVVTCGHYMDIVKQLRDRGYPNVEVVLSLLALKNNLRYGSDSQSIVDLENNLRAMVNILDDYHSQELAVSLAENWLRGQNPDKTSYRRFCINTQYFDKELIKVSPEEVFLDIGAYDGDTIFTYLRNYQDMFSHIYAWEMDLVNADRLRKNLGMLKDEIREKISVFNMGAWSETMDVHYTSFDTGSKMTNSDDAAVVGHVSTVDKELSDEAVSFVKMDIEGAELEALRGMVNTIKRCRPKLAICVYHEPEHLWEIPLWIKSVVPEYKIYLRHYQMDEYETVCYAIP